MERENKPDTRRYWKIGMGGIFVASGIATTVTTTATELIGKPIPESLLFQFGGLTTAILGTILLYRSEKKIYGPDYSFREFLTAKFDDMDEEIQYNQVQMRLGFNKGNKGKFTSLIK